MNAVKKANHSTHKVKIHPLIAKETQTSLLQGPGEQKGFSHHTSEDKTLGSKRQEGCSEQTWHHPIKVSIHLKMAAPRTRLPLQIEVNWQARKRAEAGISLEARAMKQAERKHQLTLTSWALAKVEGGIKKNLNSEHVAWFQPKLA